MIQADVAQRRQPSPGLAVDLAAAFNLIGTLAKYLGLAALFPTIIALGYGEPIWPFLAAGSITSGLGFLLERLTAGAAERMGVREGFLVVSATWLLAASFGALPYIFAGGDQLGGPLDAYFESMSGFTTTGASVVTDFESLSRSVAMWRQFTQWLGGMGIIVLALAVLPRLGVGGRQLLESEMPGFEVEALGERIRHTARRLWILYVALSAVEVLALVSLGWLGVDDRMTPYEAVAHTFSNLSTGGFSTQANSIAAFSATTQWVVILFMVVGGANFALMYRGFVRRQPRAFLHDEEFRLYLALLVVAGLVVTIQVWSWEIAKGEEAVRTAVFQVTSILTATGYATADYATWPVLGALSIFALMFVGGSAGSTAGGIKVVRHLLLGKILRRELDQTVSPELVLPVRLNGAPVDERTIRAIAAFVLLYVGAWAVGAAVIAIDSAITGAGLGPLGALGSSATALGNIGPGFDVTGPTASFAPLGEVSKVTMILLMWAGRLEIVPVVVLVTRHYWRL